MKQPSKTHFRDTVRAGRARLKTGTTAQKLACYAAVAILNIGTTALAYVLFSHLVGWDRSRSIPALLAIYPVGIILGLIVTPFLLYAFGKRK